MTFALGRTSVRLMQWYDLDVTDESSYTRSSRARTSEVARNSQLPDPPMTPELTRFVMAKFLSSPSSYSNTGDFSSSDSSSSSTTSGSRKSSSGPFYSLRLSALEEYWLHRLANEREALRTEAASAIITENSDLKSSLETVEKNWHRAWDSPKWHPDLFRDYVPKQLAAQNVWEYVEEDVLVVIDQNRRVVFANMENLSSLLYGAAKTRALARCLDMWSYFTPLPSPESFMHAVDVYIRKIHPERPVKRNSRGSAQCKDLHRPLWYLGFYR